MHAQFPCGRRYQQFSLLIFDNCRTWPLINNDINSYDLVTFSSVKQQSICVTEICPITGLENVHVEYFGDAMWALLYERNCLSQVTLHVKSAM